MNMVIEQFLSGFHYGDAIGNSVLRFHRFLLSKGIGSRIIAITIDDAVREHCIPFSQYREERESVKIYHYAIGSPMNDYFLNSGGKKVLIYHNITPAEYFKGFSEELMISTRTGRSELSLFKDRFGLCIADSHFNASELTGAGFENVVTFPIMIDRKDYDGEFSRSYMETFNDGRKNILFVGRVMPNKRIEDLVRLTAVYRKLVSGDVRMIVAGNMNGIPSYTASLLKLKTQLGLSIDDLFFTGHIPFKELLSVYRSADVFLSMSEHEGFCLPLIESSFFRLPVIAFNAGAVAETLDGSGILLDEKDYRKTALLTEMAMNNNKIRDSLRESAARRADQYERESDPGRLLDLIRNGING